MKSHLWTLLVPVVAALFMTGTTQGQAPHVFSLPGMFETGEVNSVNGDMVVIKTRSGMMFVVPMDRLNIQDKDYVTRTLAARPQPAQQPQPAEQEAASRPKLEVTWTKEKANLGAPSPKRTAAGGFVENRAEIFYIAHIRVMNRSSQPTGDLELNYQLCTSITENNFNTENKDQTILKYQVGVAKCPSLKPGAVITLDSAPFSLKTENLAIERSQRVQNVNGKNRDMSRHHKEELKGVIATLTQNGLPVFEYVAPGVKKYF